MRSLRIAVIGAGIGGLTSAIDLANAGCEVTVFERAAAPGGKMRRVEVGGARMDAGPTVFTLRRVFDQLFADAGDDFARRVTLKRARLLARHAWPDGSALDLHADLRQSTAAIGAFAGAREARAFERFAADSRRIFATLEDSFMTAPRPSTLQLARRVGVAGLPDLCRIKPFANLWQTMGRYFADARLRQLFARYATYCGSSPFECPATLMLIAHAEQAGVWYVEGGMHRLAEELAALAQRRGARLRYRTGIAAIQVRHGRVAAIETAEGEHIAVDRVVSNADNNAIASGLFGSEVARAARAIRAAKRSLSAVTFNLTARTSGFAPAHHTVFFSQDYKAEFDAICRRHELPRSPTVYVCAFDRDDAVQVPSGATERLFCLVNAPPIGDARAFTTAEIDACERGVFQALARCGLQVQPACPPLVTTPMDFHRLFPATGGALYGPASHGWRASFIRPGSRSAVPGLYLAGGSTHPGPGVPMAATSGRLAAACLLADCASTAASRPAAMAGGTSTP